MKDLLARLALMRPTNDTHRAWFEGQLARLSSFELRWLLTQLSYSWYVETRHSFYGYLARGEIHVDPRDAKTSTDA